MRSEHQNTAAPAQAEWNQFYAHVPRIDRRPIFWPVIAAVTATLIFGAVAVSVPLTPSHLLPMELKFEHKLGIVLGCAVTACGGIVLSIAAYASYHRAHTWTWGKAELVQAVWTGGEDATNTVGLKMLLMPVTVMVPGLDLLAGVAVGRLKIVATRVDGDRLQTVRTGIRFVPESGTMGYTWICQAEIWPRRWYALGDLMPGGTVNQYIPPEAIELLSAEILRIRRSATPTGSAQPKKLPGRAKVLPGGRPIGGAKLPKAEAENAREDENT